MPRKKAKKKQKSRKGRKPAAPRFIAEVFRAGYERAQRAAAVRRDRELEGRQDRRWTEWDYIEEAIDDVGGEDGDTPDWP